MKIKTKKNKKESIKQKGGNSIQINDIEFICISF